MFKSGINCKAKRSENERFLRKIFSESKADAKVIKNESLKKQAINLRNKKTPERKMQTGAA